MGAYRLAVYLKWQMQLGVRYEWQFIEISLPFILIMISTSKKAHGFTFFGLESDELFGKI